MYHYLLCKHFVDHNIIISKLNMAKQIKYPAARINDYKSSICRKKYTTVVFFKVFRLHCNEWRNGENTHWPAIMLLCLWRWSWCPHDHLTMMRKKNLQSSGFPLLLFTLESDMVHFHYKIPCVPCPLKPFVRSRFT